MLIFPKTDIQADSHFHPSNDTALKDSLPVVDERMADWPMPDKAHLLIALLEGPQLNGAWARANPALAALLISEALPVQELTNLFARSRAAHCFIPGLETCVRQWQTSITS